MCVRNTNEKSSQCGFLGDDGLAENKAAQILSLSAKQLPDLEEPAYLTRVKVSEVI